MQVPPILEQVIEPPVPARRLSTDLKELLREADGRSLTLGELEEIMKGRGFALFILLLALPFIFPLPLLGLSVPFGVVIGFMGLRIAFGMKPSLPQVVLRRELKYSLLEKIVNIGLKLCSKLEKLVRPRMHFLQRWPGMQNLIGLGIASGGLLLCLPLPPIVPLSNTIPALSVLLLTMGMIERDGLLVLLGHVVNVIAWIYFGLMFVLGREGLKQVFAYFGWG
jgi:hypothetical protein